MTEIHIREFQYPEDYSAALKLWESCGTGVHVGPSDTPTEIERKLERDADLFLVAVDGGDLIGTVIGAFDGRRGMVYHLAVGPGYRRRGIASRLMSEVESRLRDRGCLKCYLVVKPDNIEGMQYYKAIGWSLSDSALFMKELR